MEADGEQNQQRASTKASGPSSRKSTINSMSLYERQAVQALQALQRQPNAAQYFQQLMLQQQISNAQLQNLAAVQQATLAGTCQSIPFSNCSSSQTTSTTATTITSGSPTSNHPVCASAASTVSQSVLLNGTAGGQGQMYLRVNRSLRAPLSSQLIFMPGQAAAGAAATTVTKQPQAEPQEVTPTSDGHSDNHQVQYLAMRGVASSKGNSVKTEAPDRSDSATHSLVQPSSQSISTTKPAQPQSQAPHIRIPTYPQPTTLKSLPSSSRTPPSLCTSSIPLSQLLLHNTRTLTTGTTASSTTHTLLLTSSTTSHPNGYSVGTTNIKPAVSGQTLVVQPLQKTSLNTEKSGYSNGPVPIQPKTLRLPLQLSSKNPPPILPAPPPVSTTVQPPQPPHIPVQIVGARKSTLGNTQALCMARGNCGQEGGTVFTSSASLLTMVASLASKGGGALDQGAGLKTVQSPQEAPHLAQVSQVHPLANQNSGQNGHVILSPTSSNSPTVSPSVASMSQSSLFLPLVPEKQKGSSTVMTMNGNPPGNETPQAKQLSGTLKRKSNSVSAIDEGGPSPAQLLPVRDQALNSPLESVFRGVCSQGGRPALPQAVVKPNILTHLIEGFVIHEGAEPFPDSAGEELTDSPDNNQSEIVIRAKVLKCEYCKSFAPASQFKGTKRFCSMSCAKSMYWFPRYNISLRQNLSGRQGQSCALYHNPHKDNLSNSYEEGGLNKRRLPRRTSSEIASAKIAGRSIPGKATHSVQVPSQGHSEPSHSEEDTSGEEDDDLMSLSPASSASCHQPPPLIITENSAHSCLPMSPTEWSTKEVSKFIASLQGCEELASQFLSQEIDGQALLLLREEHLMSTMNIKLGPALKICAHINSLRD
ncbi:polyhomeotic-like protein 1 isoform X3 [Takifugu flavidus]|uniref:polyhomeotic-like protein 1 isoform X3 n=1 Tax=Takifugu flavidus TaxID=433684 RepID=UPI0025445651|nr:polyhomeotic-like protein 1 isoform X3 [Takifugu flavidus]